MPILTAEERVGTVLGGRYRLESILGSGGTATVYRALHSFTNRHVAVKLLNPERARDRDLVARFLKEARVASTIVHPHVVAILDMGTDDDCTYLAMELLSGESLGARLGRDGAMPVDRAITLLRPLMEAVTAAHEKGIVHRDIKPDNVLVGDRGDGVERAVLLDFGMAKTNEAAWGHMTQSGVLVGTPYYMSPEQVEGAEDLGPQTDVWSMGVLLYRALSGDLPFTGTNPSALLLAIARGEHVPLGLRAPEVPPAIASWVEGALRVDRNSRYPDMRAMLRALDDALQGIAPISATTSGVRSIDVAPIEEVPTSIAPASSRRRVVAIATMVALALGIVATAVSGFASGAPEAAATPVREPSAIVALATESPPPAHESPPAAANPVEPAGAVVDVAPADLAEAAPPAADSSERTPRGRNRAHGPRGGTSGAPPTEETPEEVAPEVRPAGSGLVTEW